MTVRILTGDCRLILPTLPAGSVHCCVTSPPYWGLRNYGCDGQLGLEPTPEEYTAALVAVFREVWRVLRDDGTLWLNLGDSYNAYNGGAGPSSSISAGAQTEERPRLETGYGLRTKGLKPKDLVGIPWRVAFALQAYGWYLRQDIIWHKPNPMPESVTDRCCKSHEYLFLLSKKPRYYFDSVAIAEPAICDRKRGTHDYSQVPGGGDNSGLSHGEFTTRTKRDVWTVTTESFRGSHFATFPRALVEPCILAGTSAKGACPKCGAPWERVTERGDRIAAGHGVNKVADEMHSKDPMRNNGTRHGTTSALTTGEKWDTKTTGWRPTCDCGETACIKCGTVLEYQHENHHAASGVSPVFKTAPADETRENVLQPSVLASLDKSAQNTGTPLRPVSPTVQAGESPTEVLQPPLFAKIFSEDEKDHQGICDKPAGLQVAIQAGGADGQSSGVCDGASGSDGGAFGASVDGDRSGSPPKRDSGGQSPRQSSSRKQKGTRQQAQGAVVRDVSALPAQVPHARKCPHCGGAVIIRPPLPVPCVVLDIFGGSGTTGDVAAANGRDAVLIELNPKYVELQQERCGLFADPIGIESARQQTHKMEARK